MERIEFNEDAINQAIDHLKKVLDYLEAVYEEFRAATQPVMQQNDIPALKEKIDRLILSYKKQIENVRVMHNKLASIRDIYVATEMKNLKAVGKISRDSSIRSTFGILNQTDKNIQIVFSNNNVIFGQLLTKRSVQHENWLIRSVDQYL